MAFLSWELEKGSIGAAALLEEWLEAWDLPEVVELSWREAPLVFNRAPYEYEAPFAYEAWWGERRERKLIGWVTFTLSYIKGKRALVVVSLQGKEKEGRGLYKKALKLFEELGKIGLDLYLLHPAYNHHTSQGKASKIEKPIRAPYSFYGNRKGEEVELVGLGVLSKMDRRLFYELYFVVEEGKVGEIEEMVRRKTRERVGSGGKLERGRVVVKRLGR